MAGRDLSAELFGSPAKPVAGRDLSAELFGTKPKEEGFFSNIGKLAYEGGERAIGAARVSPSVISGNVGPEQAGIISQQLSMKPAVQPKELTEVQGAFKDEAEALTKAKGFTESVGPVFQFIGELGKQALTNPKGVAYLTAQSAANMAPSLAGMIAGGKLGALAGSAVAPGPGTAVGAVTGSIAGGFAGSAPMEIGSEFMQNVAKELSARGMEPTEGNVKALLQDKAFVDKAVSEARTKGVTTAGIDAVTTAGAGRFATGPARAAMKTAQAELGAAADAAKVASRAEEILKQGTKAQRAGRAVKRGAGAVGIDVAGGGLSEAAGQYAAYGEIDPESIGLEMLGELGGSAIEVPGAAYATGKDALRSKAKKDAAEILSKEQEQPKDIASSLKAAGMQETQPTDLDELERRTGMASVREEPVVEPVKPTPAVTPAAPVVEPAKTVAAPIITPAETAAPAAEIPVVDETPQQKFDRLRGRVARMTDAFRDKVITNQEYESFEAELEAAREAVKKAPADVSTLSPLKQEILSIAEKIEAAGGAGFARGMRNNARPESREPTEQTMDFYRSRAAEMTTPKEEKLIEPKTYGLVEFFSDSDKDLNRINGLMKSGQPKVRFALGEASDAIQKLADTIQNAGYNIDRLVPGQVPPAILRLKTQIGQIAAGASRLANNADAVQKGHKRADPARIKTDALDLMRDIQNADELTAYDQNVPTAAEQMEGVEVPPSPEVEELLDKQRKASADIGIMSQRTAGTSLIKVLQGQLKDSEISELGGKARKIGKNPFISLAAKKGKPGSSMEDMVESGALDLFLPYKMRPGTEGYENSESAEYIREKLRNGEFYTDDMRQEIDATQRGIFEIEKEIDELLNIEDINKEIQYALEEQRRADQEAAEPAAPEETGAVEESPEQEAEELITSQTEEELKRKQAEIDRLNKENERLTKEAERKAKADEEAGDFVLTGSDRTADKAAARGQMDLTEEPVGEKSGDDTESLQAAEKVQTGYDIDPEDQRVEKELTGKTMLQAADWSVKSAPNAFMRVIAEKVRNRLRELERRGVEFDFKVEGGGTRSRDMFSSRGITNFKWGDDQAKISVRLNGAAVMDNQNGYPSGMRYETVLHELLHVATRAQFKYLPADSGMGKQLVELSDAIIKRFNADAKAGKLPPIMERYYKRMNNALEDPDEILAWGLTNKEVQDYFADIKVGEKSAMTRLVELIRDVLGLGKPYESALDRLVTLSESMLDTNVGEIESLMSKRGKKLGKARAPVQESLFQREDKPVTFYEDIPNENWLQGKIDYAVQSPRNQFGVPKMSSVTGSFKSPVMVPTRWLKDAKGQRGEENNVRQKDLDAIRKIIRETGKFPLNEDGTEYVPYIEIGYDGKPWVSEGNHRIMAAIAEGLEYIPVELRYFDGGQRRAGKWAPDNIKEITERKLSEVNEARGQREKPLATDTPAFKRWFGDSKVVDENGEPRVMYHSTSRDFSIFDRLKSTERRKVSMDTVGSWFSSEPSKAEQYAGGEGQNTMPVYLSIKNPKLYRSFNDFLREMHEAEGRKFEEQNPPGVGSTEGLRAKLKAEGYDGIQFEQTDNESLYQDIKQVQESIAQARKEEFGVKRADRAPYTMKRERLERTLQSMKAELEKMGGSTEFDGQDVFVALEPTQIKSATGNRGTYDPNDADIRNQRENVLGEPVAGNWTLQPDTKLDLKDGFIYKLLDKNIDIKRVIEAITKESGEMMARWNPYLQEELYHGRTANETKDFKLKEMRPLLQEMKRDGITIGEFEKYLQNRHAEEYNKQVAKVNQDNDDMQDGGSGILTADAQKYLADLPEDKRAKYESLAKRVDDITKGTREILVNSGMESRETIKAWEKVFPHYVPLQREDGDFEYTTSSTGTGRGFDVRGAFSRGAMGSKRQVVDIMANIALSRERAIVKANKNRVAQAVYGLAVQNANPDFWLAVNPLAEKMPEFAIEELREMGIDEEAVEFLMKEPRQRAIDPKKGQVISRINTMLRNSDYVLSMRLNGENRYVFFNQSDPRAKRAVTALKNLDAEQLGAVMSTIAKVTRWMAAVNTQYNPIFGAYNFLRDVQGAALQLSDTPLAGKQKQVVAGTLPALKAIYASMRAERKGKEVDTDMAKLWADFQGAGGQTGFRDMFSRSQDRAEALQKELAMMSEGKVKGAGRAVFNWLSDYNDTMENAVRLSAYKTALESGIGRDEAASIAKNLTVNFNKKGQIATQAGALYAFFNAAMQGTARLHKTLTGPAGKKIMAGGLLLGVIQATMFAAAGFDDEEPPEFVRERNVIIPTGWLTGKKDYIMFPMPLGYHVIPGTSRIMTEWAMSGFKKTGDRIASLTGMYLEAFNPIGNAGWSVQTFAPTFADPFVALAENRDWTGKPIAKKDLNSLDPTPGYQRAKDAASWLSTKIAEFLNYSSGGTKYQPGLFSPTPDQIDYLIGQATGGLGREILKASTSIEKTYTGEDLPVYKIPVVGRFYGETTGSAAESNRFYKNVEQINKLENEIKGRRENKEPLGDFISENPEVRLAKRSREIQTDIKKLRDRKEKLVERNAPRESVKVVEEQITRKMKMLNDRVAELEK